MLYTVSLDENNYIMSVGHTSNDNVELDLESMELEYLNAYQLVEGQAVLDEERKAEIIAQNEEQAKQMEIITLTEQLKATDEDMLDFVERLFSFKNPLTFIADMINLMKDYATLVSNRQSIREQLRRLQG